MRIGIFSESYEPVLNGVSVSITTLTRELKNLGHQVWVFAPRFKGHRDRESQVVRFPSFCTPVARDYPLAVPYLPGLTGRIRELELDVIHTHTPFMLGWLGLRLAKRLDIPIVSTNHTLYTEYAHYFPLAPRSATRLFITGMLKRYYQQCDAVIVPSGPVRELLRSYGIDVPIHVIPTAISLDLTRDPAVRSQMRQEYGIPDNARVLLYVGRLAREKNLELLLNAFDILASKHPDIHLLIVGGGPYEPRCRSLANALRNAERVKFTGYVAREKVGRYYSVGDVFAFPSLTETQGLVVAEALCAGLPCVAVNAGGTPEMFVDGEDGMLARNDVNDFASKIDTLLSEPGLLKTFSVRAMKNAERFSPGEMSNKVLQVYESVLAKAKDSMIGR